MPIITISRGSFSRGKEVAEIVAKKLDYTCISREILVEASEEFDIPEVKLIKALHDAPSVLDRFNHGRERYISCIRSAFLDHMKQNNIVYHGLAGHLFLPEISHVLKVRIIASMESRISEEVKREQCSEEEARYRLNKDDDERRRWSMQLYGKDPWDSRLYDMVLHIDTLQVDDVADILVSTIQKEQFTPTKQSIQNLASKALLANIHTRLVKESPFTSIRFVDEGIVALSNLSGTIKNDLKARRILAERLIKEFGLHDILFEDPPRSSNNYVNTWYNLSLN